METALLYEDGARGERKPPDGHPAKGKKENETLAPRPDVANHLRFVLTRFSPDRE
jgi:hypothetical protein